jgi:hypothetical protein
MLCNVKALKYVIYSVHYGKEGMLSSVSDVDSYVIIIKLLDSIFSVLPTFICRLEIETYMHRTFRP